MPFLHSSIAQMHYQKQVAEKAFAQISDDALNHQTHEDENSIAMIVHHLYGNMMSRWTNIFEEDGEKTWRDRDAEFEYIKIDKDTFLRWWHDGWHQFLSTLESMTEDDLDREIYIRNQTLTVQDAIIRQIAHYSYHCGQIVYKCKQLVHQNWHSLSIPKNKSKSYNKEKFAIDRGKDKYVDKLKET